MQLNPLVFTHSHLCGDRMEQCPEWARYGHCNSTSDFYNVTCCQSCHGERRAQSEDEVAAIAIVSSLSALGGRMLVPASSFVVQRSREKKRPALSQLQSIGSFQPGSRLSNLFVYMCDELRILVMLCTAGS